MQRVCVKGLVKGMDTCSGTGTHEKGWREAESLVKKVLTNQWYGGKEHLMNICG